MTVAVTAVIALMAALAIATASLGVAYAARARAQSAADAVSLAAAVATYPATGRSAPATEGHGVAALNGARLVECRCRVDAGLSARTVTVVVAVDLTIPIFGDLAVTGAARAEFDPRRWLGR
jgi:hypothetical protein